MAGCIAPVCPNPAHGRGLCRAHYMRMWRFGTYNLPVRIKPTIRERLERYVDRESKPGCWTWTRALATSGYGVLAVNRVRQYAHRLSYEVYVGPIPAGLTIDHLCRTRRCINPTHLEAVTQKENNRRASVKTHCLRGHDLAKWGYVRRAADGRFCRKCAGGARHEQQRLARAANRARPCDQCGLPVGGRKARKLCEACSKIRKAATMLVWQRARRAQLRGQEVRH